MRGVRASLVFANVCCQENACIMCASRVPYLKIAKAEGQTDRQTETGLEAEPQTGRHAET